MTRHRKPRVAPVIPAAHDVSVLTLNDSYTATFASHCNSALELSLLLIAEGAGDETAAGDWDTDVFLVEIENDDDDDADDDYDDDDTTVKDNDDKNVTTAALPAVVMPHRRSSPQARPRPLPRPCFLR